MRNGGKILEKVKKVIEDWEELKGYLEMQTANLLRMDIEKLVEIRQTFNKLSQSIDNYRQNIDTILKEKIPPKEKVSTPFGTVIHFYYPKKQYDYEGMRKRLEELGELDKYIKGEDISDFIKVYPNNKKK